VMADETPKPTVRICDTPGCDHVAEWRWNKCGVTRQSCIKHDMQELNYAR